MCGRAYLRQRVSSQSQVRARPQCACATLSPSFASARVLVCFPVGILSGVSTSSSFSASSSSARRRRRKRNAFFVSTAAAAQRNEGVDEEDEEASSRTDLKTIRKDAATSVVACEHHQSPSSSSSKLSHSCVLSRRDRAARGCAVVCVHARGFTAVSCALEHATFCSCCTTVSVRVRAYALVEGVYEAG